MAEYTTLKDLDPDEIRTEYDIGEVVSIEPVPGGAANSSFRLRGVKDGGTTDYALTVLDNDPASAPRLASLLGRLSGRFDTTALVRSRDDQPAVAIGERVMILKLWVDGNVYPVFPADLLGEAGKALARLHALAADEVIGDEPLPSPGRRLTTERRSHIADFADRAFADWLTVRLAALDDIQSGRQHTLIHGDLYSDNIIVRENGELVIIDWETACREDPLLDLGMAIIGLGVVEGRLVPERVEAIVDGYSAVLPLTEQERAGVLRDMVELSALIIAFHRYYRHNVRYPGSPAADKYREMVGIVDSLADCALHGR
ncbi:phosphotransferase [Nocardia sp. NPDC058519]|uniref:phosphotransferase n=1 Tax=Nocardia sp. NPDC058519 TaxID=3346535 RepID=UPI00365BC955